jgi:hypothetical protein
MPDSVSPVGVSHAPMKSLRGIALLLALVAACLLIFIVMRRGETPGRGVQAASSGAERVGSGVAGRPSPTAAVGDSSASRLNSVLVAASAVGRAVGEETKGERSPSRTAPGIAPTTRASSVQALPGGTSEAARAAARAKSATPIASSRRSTTAPEAVPNHDSSQDPFEKPFFPPTK